MGIKATHVTEGIIYLSLFYLRGGYSVGYAPVGPTLVNGRFG